MYSVVLSSIASVPVLQRLLDTLAVLVFLVPFLDIRVQETKNGWGAVQKRKNRLFNSAPALLVQCFLNEGICLKIRVEASFHSSPHFDRIG